MISAVPSGLCAHRLSSPTDKSVGYCRQIPPGFLNEGDDGKTATNLFFFADLAELDGSCFWSQDERAEAPLASRFDYLHVIFGRADLFASGVEEVQLDANSEALRVRVVAQSSNGVNETAAWRLLQRDLRDFEIID